MLKLIFICISILTFIPSYCMNVVLYNLNNKYIILSFVMNEIYYLVIFFVIKKSY